jgi:uncharacterized protein YgbK (DUF1537 family)
MQEIIFKPKALYSGFGGLEVLAGAVLEPDEIHVLVKAAISPDHFSPVFLIHNSGHRQRLSAEQLETVLAEPLAAYRQKLAQEAAEAAEAMEKAAEAAEAQRAAQEAAVLAAQAQEEKAKKLQFQTAIG